MNNKLIILLILIYIASILISRNFIKIIYSKNGFLENNKINNTFIIFTFLPIINTFFGLISYTFISPVNGPRKFKFLSVKKIFNIKR